MRHSALIICLYKRSIRDYLAIFDIFDILNISDNRQYLKVIKTPWMSYIYICMFIPGLIVKTIQYAVVPVIVTYGAWRLWGYMTWTYCIWNTDYWRSKCVYQYLTSRCIRMPSDVFYTMLTHGGTHTFTSVNRVCGANPLPEPMLIFVNWSLRNNFSKIWIKIKQFP